MFDLVLNSDLKAKNLREESIRLDMADQISNAREKGVDCSVSFFKNENFNFIEIDPNNIELNNSHLTLRHDNKEIIIPYIGAGASACLPIITPLDDKNEKRKRVENFISEMKDTSPAAVVFTQNDDEIVITDRNQFYTNMAGVFAGWRFGVTWDKVDAIEAIDRLNMNGIKLGDSASEVQIFQS